MYVKPTSTVLNEECGCNITLCNSINTRFKKRQNSTVVLRNSNVVGKIIRKSKEVITVEVRRVVTGESKCSCRRRGGNGRARLIPISLSYVCLRELFCMCVVLHKRKG